MGHPQDIHPAARIGCGLMMDHATGVVMGETVVVGDNVSLLHHVTLGGTGTTGGDRHPKVGGTLNIPPRGLLSMCHHPRERWSSSDMEPTCLV